MSTNAPSKKARHFSFDVQTATEYGVDEAIMIQNFVFWIEKNLANGKNCHDGRTWTYNTQQAFTFLFPFWSYKQIRRILDSLVKQCVLVTGNYNKTPFDRTLWYAFKNESDWLNTPENTTRTLEDIEVSKSSNAEKIDSPKRANVKIKTGESDSPKRANGKSQTVEPIPYIKTNTFTDTDNNTTSKLSANSEQSVDKDLLLSLNEIQKQQASKKLSELSPTQKALVIQIFNKTVSEGKVKSAPMALFHQLFNLALQNALESPKTPETLPPARPVPTLKERQIKRIEAIKAFISSSKLELLKQFQQRGFVVISSLGIIIEPDLRAAGLFD